MLNSCTTDAKFESKRKTTDGRQKTISSLFTSGVTERFAERAGIPDEFVKKALFTFGSITKTYKRPLSSGTSGWRKNHWMGNLYITLLGIEGEKGEMKPIDEVNLDE
ncbi:hypothetical protein VNI00_015563 [Paramarasmius palmivorus]|uniref:Uncharacterized protein n=1 Tax=Paramarasmius palmivorus TaxID=297713 RepID=A0AAW0BJM5_9AGAR